MLPTGRGAVAKSVLGLALGVGACYCVYKVLSVARCRKKRVAGSSILDKVSGIELLASVQGTESENNALSAGNLEPHHIKTLLQILLTNSEIQERVLVTLCNSAAFLKNHDLIRNLDGVRIISGFLSDPNPKLRVKALNALNNLSMNLQNQEQIKDYINEICEDIAASPLNSEVQLAGLRLVINMSFNYNYHDRMVDYIPSFLTLLVKGNEVTQKYTLKVLVNFSANPLMAMPLLANKVHPSLTSIFDSCTNKDILLRALTFSANISENLGRVQLSRYNYNSLYGLLFGDVALCQRYLAPLLQHPDIEVKEQAARCISNLSKIETGLTDNII
ncbi:armadillo repeat-containing protein 10-like [Mixophyes fleayi]|uniref:armadillo repeat-containing protein 10-like n=1 Tax=Mixophyes fleayi TaxID=3061075 RepID=UPI003F4DE0B7